MRDGLITAILNDLGTYPEISELFIILSNVSLNNDSACLRSFVGIGSSRHVDDLDEKIRELSSGRSMCVKASRSAPGCGGVTEVVMVHRGRAIGTWRGRRL